MRKILIIFFIFIAVGNNLGISAQSDSTNSDNSMGFFVAPVLIYFPETRFAGGAAFILYEKLDSTDKHNKPNELTGYGMYTQNNQIMTQSTLTLYLDSLKYKFINDAMVYKFPDKFFGIGPGAQYEGYEKYTPFFIRLKASFLRKISDNTYLGPNYRYYYYEIIKKEKGRQIDTAGIRGSDIARLSGFGLRFYIDKRDKSFFPTSGYQLDIKSRFYAGWLGSQYNFSRIDIDFRQYFSIFNNHVFAWQTQLQSASGEIPFDRLPEIGDEVIMRGYHAGRYRDNNKFAIQGEYRFPLFWRIGGSAFAGIGQVAHSINKFTIPDFHPAYGLGIRINIDKEQHINLRADAAYCEDGWQFYFNIKEAF